MINLNNKTLIFGSSLVFSTALLTTVFNATNPEYNFPGITETLLIGVSILLVANSFFIGKSLTRREWLLGGIFLILIVILAIRYLLGWSDTETIPSRRCILMTGFFAKLECFLQLPFKSHHGLRQLLFHFTAMSVFVGVSCLSRMAGVLRPWLLITLSIPSIIVAIGVIIPIYYDPNFSLTGNNFVYSPFEINRGKGIVSNPSWLWPWLTPVMGMSLAAIFNKNWVLKCVGLSLFSIFAWTSLSVMQRGGYLIIGVFISCLIILFFYRLGEKWSKNFALLLGGIVTLGFGIFVYYPTKILDILKLIKHLGIELRGPGLLYFDTRLFMWDLAKQSIQEHPWIGTGYGTWLREFSKLPGSDDLSFDTAHNIWIQMIFELGIIHTVAMVILLGIFVLTTLIYKNFDQPSLKIGGLFLIIGFFVASMVQEIDYILPVYLQFATFAGLCFGGTSYPENIIKLHSRNQFRASNNNVNQHSKTNKLAWSMVGISLLGVLGAFYYASNISWGGSSFEPTQHAFNRWFRPVGVIAATPDNRRREYSIFWSDHGQFDKKSFITYKDFPEIWIQGNSIYLKNGSKWKPNQYLYENQNNIYHPQRLVSFALHLPHGQTNSIILAENGMYPWEFGGMSEDGVMVGRWCKKQCNFLLYHPNTKKQPHGVQLKMPLPGLDENHPVRLFVTMQSITDEIPSSLSEKYIQQMINKPFSKNSSKKELVFSNVDDIYRLPTEPGPYQLWLISLKTDRTIIPKEHDKNSTDGRELGVRVLF